VQESGASDDCTLRRQHQNIVPTASPSRSDSERLPMAFDPKQEDRDGPKRINLALQGGGAHGAFAWGVLDRLLEDERIDLEGIVGTSAGAMNAAITAYGLMQGGHAGARNALAKFWRAVADKGKFSLMQASWFDQMNGPGRLDFSPAWFMFDLISRMWSPYQLNPGNYHPLREILTEHIDFEALRGGDGVKLYVCATNVMTNRLRVFERSDMCVGAVLASACLPSLFQAVEVDGEHYWDGGYIGNPPIFPLIYNCVSPDILLVMINPIEISELPQTAQAILDRINTLSFNSSLMREMRAVEFVNHLVEHGFDDGGRLKKVRIHCIDAENEMRSLGVSSKLNVGWDFLQGLFSLGRKKAEAFLTENFDKLGKESSTIISERFL
jgi:NTE family protein